MSAIESKPTNRSRSTAKRTTTKARLPKNEPDLQSRIEIAAYYKALARGFVPGYELDDWLAAEKEISQ